MARVSAFLLAQRLLGDTAGNTAAIGVELADGRVIGAATNVKFRIDTRFMRVAAAGAL